ncbi:hypothetical protein [Streptomyces sirii]|uniref:hypothetical protein n=1 Tax=Streptomyces sirii TaxID=3127701 RepID=UPI003D367990
MSDVSDQPDQPKKPFLYAVGCAAGIAGDVGKSITTAQKQQWDVGVVATPQALGFIDVEAIEARTGYPTRSAWRRPSDPRRKRYESRRSIAGDLLFALAADGHLSRASRRGGWTSNQHAWMLAPELPDIPAPLARSELVRHWLVPSGRAPSPI